MHACAQVLLDLEEMRGRENCRGQITHKEEFPGRIKSDQIDRGKIRKTVESTLHPLDMNENPDGLVNNYSGSISFRTVNVDDALEIGKKQQDNFNDSLPNGFYQPVKKAITKKSVKVGDINEFDTEIILPGVTCLQNAGQIHLQDVFAYELSPIPVSLFKDSGDMRPADSKSDFKKN